MYTLIALLLFKLKTLIKNKPSVGYFIIYKIQYYQKNVIRLLKIITVEIIELR